MILPVAHGIPETLGKVAGQNHGHPVEILRQVGDKDRTKENGVRDRLGDLALAATRYRTRLVAEGSLRAGPHQTPRASGHGGWLQMHPETAGKEVMMISTEAQGPRLAGVIPTNRERFDVKTRILRHVDHFRKPLVQRVAFGLEVDGLGNQPRDLREAVGEISTVLLGVVFTAEIMTGEDQGSAGVLFFHQPEQVGRKADLGFNLLLAVAEVIVRDEGHNDPGRIPRGQLEGVSIVVELARIVPAHAVPTLTLGGFVAMRKTDLLLGEPVEVRRQNHTTGVAAPVLGIEGRVIFRQHRVTRIAEDALNEVQIGHQRSRHEEPDLHALAGRHTGHLRANDRPDEQRDHTGRRSVSG